MRPSAASVLAFSSARALAPGMYSTLRRGRICMGHLANGRICHTGARPRYPAIRKARAVPRSVVAISRVHQPLGRPASIPSDSALLRRSSPRVNVDTADIVIVGGGIVGSACRLFSEHGCRVVGPAHRHDRARRRRTRTGSTGRSAGGVRQQFSTPENIAMSQFTLSVFRSLKAMFGADADVGFREQGYLLLATPETQSDPGRERRPAAVDGRRHRVARCRRAGAALSLAGDGWACSRRLWPNGRGLVRSAEPRRPVPQGGAAARCHRSSMTT